MAVAAVAAAAGAAVAAAAAVVAAALCSAGELESDAVAATVGLVAATAACSAGGLESEGLVLPAVVESRPANAVSEPSWHKFRWLGLVVVRSIIRIINLSVTSRVGQSFY